MCIYTSLKSQQELQGSSQPSQQTDFKKKETFNNPTKALIHKENILWPLLKCKACSKLFQRKRKAQRTQQHLKSKS